MLKEYLKERKGLTKELQERAYLLTREIKVLDKPTYEVAGHYKRFNQKNNLALRSRWDEKLKKTLNCNHAHAIKIKNIQQNVKGYTLEDYALAAAARIGIESLGTNQHARARI